MWRFFFALLVMVAFRAHASTDNAFSPHLYKEGEVHRYSFDNSEINFLVKEVNGGPQVGKAVHFRGIQFSVQVEAFKRKGALTRNLTLEDKAGYREGLPEEMSKIPFADLRQQSRLIPAKVSYSYVDDTFALNNLEQIFSDVYGVDLSSSESFFDAIIGDARATALFFKMQDVHQMQESIQMIPEGMKPGDVRIVKAHERPGFGGHLKLPQSVLMYEKVVEIDGIRCAYFKSTVLGLEFLQPTRKTVTNFFFSAHVALEGPRKGLLVLGEGQETATIYNVDQNSNKLKLQSFLQRQFSIRSTGHRAK